MKPNDFDVTLYDAGTHLLIDSVSAPLVALADNDALDALCGYLTVYLAQSGSLGIVANADALQAFILHAQRARVTDVEFMSASFSKSVVAQVPQSPPVSPANLWLTDAGSGMVNASSDMGENCDRYELQRLVNGVWEFAASGVTREDGVDYQVSGVSSGEQHFRVIARYGFFAGFPGKAKLINMEE